MHSKSTSASSMSLACALCILYEFTFAALSFGYFYDSFGYFMTVSGGYVSFGYLNDIFRDFKSVSGTIMTVSGTSVTVSDTCNSFSYFNESFGYFCNSYFTTISGNLCLFRVLHDRYFTNVSAFV